MASLLDRRGSPESDVGHVVDVIDTVRTSRAAAKHSGGDSDFPVQDVDCAVAIDAFDFAMKVEQHGGRSVARPVRPPDYR
jgi:hypothetical protein